MVFYISILTICNAHTLKYIVPTLLELELLLSTYTLIIGVIDIFIIVILSVIFHNSPTLGYGSPYKLNLQNAGVKNIY